MVPSVPIPSTASVLTPFTAVKVTVPKGLKPVVES